MKQEKFLQKLWNGFTTALVVLLVVCTLFLVGARLMGYQVFTVISGSMEPEYSVGDLIYVKDVDASKIEVGMPITFVLNEDLVVATHRVVEVDTENQYFYTKGDANDTVDSAPVHFNNVIGVPQFAIPYLGYVSNCIQNPPMTYIVVGMVGVLVLGMFLPDFLKKKRESKED